jgi:hypothetical protein
MNETHLPLIVDIDLHSDLQGDLDHTAHRFRGAIQKFLNNKEKSKKHYPKGKEHNFILHELVMRKDYTPASALNPTFIGPYRIVEIQPQGAIIKDPRTGDIMSVHFQNLRKLTVDEFITLLPTNFDSDLLKTLGFYRYNKPGRPDTVENTIPVDQIEDTPLQCKDIPEQKSLDEQNQDLNQDEQFPPYLTRVLRSGKKIRISTSSLPDPYKEQALHAEWKKLPSITETVKPPIINTPPCIVSSLGYTYTPYVYFEQKVKRDDDGHIFLFQTTLDSRAYRIKLEKNFKSRYKSRFSSTRTGVLIIDLEPEEYTKKSKVRFDKLEIYFY